MEATEKKVNGKVEKKNSIVASQEKVKTKSNWMRWLHLIMEEVTLSRVNLVVGNG